MRVLLCPGLLYLRLALLADTTIAMKANYNAVFSDELSAELTPCRIFPRGNGVHQCTSQDMYYMYHFFYFGPQPSPIEVNFTATPPQEGTCALANNTCRFVEEVPTCVSWLRDCDNEYSCTSEEEYEVATENETVCSFPASRPPPPNSVCVPVNNSCEWRNPCRMWPNWCGWEYLCGSEAQYAAFLHGPQPICRYPPSNASIGECVYQNNMCEWSECRSWLSPCRTSWMCGSDYEYRAVQALPPPPCPFPGEDFVPPAEPGICKYDLVSEECRFQEEPVCTGGQEYQTCGTPCPRTCDNYQLDLACIQYCVQGCFCPGSTVLHEGECIPSDQCPGENPCNAIDCQSGYECQIFDETGGAFCSPNCEDLNPCEPQEQCVITAVACVRAPCPGVLSCEPANCTGGKQWKECACPLTCDNSDTVLSEIALLYNITIGCCEGCLQCPEEKVELDVCVCPEGKVELDGVCVESSMCSGCDNCQEGEVCSVLITDGFQYPHVVCKGPTAVPCSPETSLACPSNSRCLTHNISGTSFCLESCYLQNGGCSDEQVCYSEREDEDCNPLLESCFKTTCTDIPDTLGTCPIGWKHSGCASACPTTCEDYLEPQLRPCSAVCAPCECPRGMVVFRDRCVDPLECYTLMTESALNPLPQPEDVLLIQITVIGVSLETFDSSRLANSVQKIFEELGFENLQVEVYAVFVEDGNTVVVLRLKGGDVRSGLMAGLIMDNRDAFSVNIAAVSTVNTPSATEEPEDDDDVPIGIVVGSVVAVTVVCSLLLLALIIFILVTMRSLKTKDAHLEVSAEEKQKSVDYLSFSNLDS